jgi:hypothetical protein
MQLAPAFFSYNLQWKRKNFKENIPNFHLYLGELHEKFCLTGWFCKGSVRIIYFFFLNKKSFSISYVFWLHFCCPPLCWGMVGVNNLLLHFQSTHWNFLKGFFPYPVAVMNSDPQLLEILTHGFSLHCHHNCPLSSRPFERRGVILLLFLFK